jgi:hypothetical protein
VTALAVFVGAALGAGPIGVAAVLNERARAASARAARARIRAARAAEAEALAAAAVARAERDLALRCLAGERASAAGRDRGWRDELLNVERGWHDCAWEWRQIVDAQDRRIDAYRRRRRGGVALATLDIDPLDVPTEAWALTGPDAFNPAGPGPADPVDQAPEVT